MGLDKNTLVKLKKYAQAFKEAHDREANESDTVMFLIKFFEEILGYDTLGGEISKEVSIKDRYCDFCIKLDGSIQFLVEAKAAGHKTLREKDIEQAENYAARSGVQWVLLTNGMDWKLYHLTFNEGEGIAHDIAFEFNLPEKLEMAPDQVWDNLSMLTKDQMKKGALEEYWSQKKAMAPASLIRVLFGEPVLTLIRRELNRGAEARLDLEDVFAAVKEVISKDAILIAGDITLKQKRRRRRKVKKVDPTTGQTTETEEDDIEDKSSEVESSSTPLPVPVQEIKNPK